MKLPAISGKFARFFLFPALLTAGCASGTTAEISDSRPDVQQKNRELDSSGDARLIQIHNAKAWLAFRDAWNGGAYAKDPVPPRVQLTADIDLGKQRRWTPVGTAERPFDGVLEGAGHQISGSLTCDLTESPALNRMADGVDEDEIPLIGDMDVEEACGLFGFMNATTRAPHGPQVRSLTLGLGVSALLPKPQAIHPDKDTGTDRDKDKNTGKNTETDNAANRKGRQSGNAGEQNPSQAQQQTASRPEKLQITPILGLGSLAGAARLASLECISLTDKARVSLLIPKSEVQQEANHGNIGNNGSDADASQQRENPYQKLKYDAAVFPEIGGLIGHAEYITARQVTSAALSEASGDEVILGGLFGRLAMATLDGVSLSGTVHVPEANHVTAGGLAGSMMGLIHFGRISAHEKKSQLTGAEKPKQPEVEYPQLSDVLFSGSMEIRADVSAKDCGRAVTGYFAGI